MCVQERSLSNAAGTEEDIFPCHWPVPGSLFLVPIHHPSHGLQTCCKVPARKVRVYVSL